MVTALDLYKFGSYRPLREVLSLIKVEVRDLNEQLINEFGPGRHDNLTISQVDYDTKNRPIVWLAKLDLEGRVQAEHKDVLGFLSQPYQDLVSLFNPSSFDELVGKKVTAYLYQPKDCYQIYLINNVYQLCYRGDVWESDNLSELVQYAKQNRWSSGTTRVGRFYRTK